MILPIEKNPRILRPFKRREGVLSFETFIKLTEIHNMKTAKEEYKNYIKKGFQYVIENLL
jgi:hypothetical protein